MKGYYLRFYRVVKTLMLALVFTEVAHAAVFEPGDEFSVQVNVHNVHYDHDQDHLRYSPLIGAEWRRKSGWLYGGALFINSFRQFSQTVYVGHLWDLGDSGFYIKLVAGVIHGYVGRSKDKVALNYGGFFPAIMPGIGYRIGNVGRIETQFFGMNGLMVTAGIAFH